MAMVIETDVDDSPINYIHRLDDGTHLVWGILFISFYFFHLFFFSFFLFLGLLLFLRTNEKKEERAELEKRRRHWSFIFIATAVKMGKRRKRRRKYLVHRCMFMISTRRRTWKERKLFDI
jgi:hypothetical protein